MQYIVKLKSNPNTMLQFNCYISASLYTGLCLVQCPLEGGLNVFVKHTSLLLQLQKSHEPFKLFQCNGNSFLPVILGLCDDLVSSLNNQRYWLHVQYSILQVRFSHTRKLTFVVSNFTKLQPSYVKLFELVTSYFLVLKKACMINVYRPLHWLLNQYGYNMKVM